MRYPPDMSDSPKHLSKTELNKGKYTGMKYSVRPFKPARGVSRLAAGSPLWISLKCPKILKLCERVGEWGLVKNKCTRSRSTAY